MPTPRACRCGTPRPGPRRRKRRGSTAHARRARRTSGRARPPADRTRWTMCVFCPICDFGQPFAAQPVQPGLAIFTSDVERVVALEVGGEAEAEAQVIGPPGLLARLDDHHALAGSRHDAVVHALEIAAPVDAPQICADLFLGQRLARLRLHQRAQHLGVGALQSLERGSRPRGRAACLGDLRRAQRRVLLGRQAVAAAASRRARAASSPIRIASPARSKLAAEMSPSSGAIRTSVSSRLFELLLDRRLAEEIDELGDDGERGGDLVALQRRRRDVHRDDDVGAQLARLVDRQVVGDAAVHQQPAVDLDRRHRAGHRHAGAHRLRDAAAIEHDRLAGLDVRGHGAEWNRQLLEIADVIRRRSVSPRKKPRSRRRRLCPSAAPARRP